MHSSVRQRRPIRAFDANDTETSLKASTPIVAVGKASAIAVPFRAEAYRGLFARLGGGLIIGTVLSWLVLDVPWDCRKKRRLLLYLGSIAANVELMIA